MAQYGTGAGHYGAARQGGESVLEARRGGFDLKTASSEIRMGFIRKVYGLLSVQLILTCAIAAPLAMQGKRAAHEHAPMLYVSMMGLMAMMFVMMCCQEHLRKFPTNYIFLFFMTGCMSVLVGFSSASYTMQSVLVAAGITAAVFVAMTIYAWTTTSDFTGLGPYIFAAMMCFMFFGFALMIMSACGIHIQWLRMVYNVMGVLMFTFYIVFDTQRIIGQHGGHKHEFGIDDYVFASLALYMDIVNLFLHLLQLIGDRQ